MAGWPPRDLSCSFLAFGSAVLPVKAIVMNVLRLSATFGVIVWVFQWGHLSRFLQFTPTGTIDPHADPDAGRHFGLSMDYEVFLLSRIREFYDQAGDNTAVVAAGLQQTGGVITSVALLQVVVVGAVLRLRIMFIKMIGVGMIVAADHRRDGGPGPAGACHHAPAGPGQLVGPAPAAPPVRPVRDQGGPPARRRWPPDQSAEALAGPCR